MDRVTSRYGEDSLRPASLLRGRRGARPPEGPAGSPLPST